MKLPALSSSMSLKGKRVFLRVDWNVPLHGGLAAEDSLKVTRTLTTIKQLRKRGAIVLVATHLGRPKKKDASLSTKKLLTMILAHDGLSMEFVPDALDTAIGLKKAQQQIVASPAGAVLLLENVRFYPGEEKNDRKLANAFASLADLFINDAFASCHRAHASVVGITSLLPSFAGPNLIEEVHALERVIQKPKHPFVAIVGGAKISTKIHVINAIGRIADTVMIGGAMATAFFAAKKLEIGTSYVEQEGIALAKKLLKNPKIRLPIDAVVASKIVPGARGRSEDVGTLKKTDAIGDIGPATMRAWAAEIKKAKTIVWNGPVGVTEIPAFAHGSLFLARAIASKSKGPAYGVIGGGDTLPVVLRSGMSEWVDHISTGGGAMLEFLTTHGKLPGIQALTATRHKKKKI